ncbi:MAG: hypothetical protein RLZZ58_2230 [Pseudomonadota bacterium]|jgi:hypothetical protein
MKMPFTKAFQPMLKLPRLEALSADGTESAVVDTNMEML